MDLELRIDGDTARIKLPPTMAIAEAVGLKTSLQEVVDARPRTVVADLDAVMAVDTAALQVLTAFVAAMRRDGVSLQWDNLSVPMYMAACHLNLEEHLQL